MILSAIYRSSKQEQMYLYIECKGDFSRVPEELIKNFGTPRFVMLLRLDKQKKLIAAKVERVKELLHKQGYYLQLPLSVDGEQSKF